MRYTVLGFLCVATVISYVQRLALSAPTKIIEAELEITSQRMGIVMAVWYWGYALCQVPSGWLADRLGSRMALLCFAVVWSVLTAATGMVTGFTGLLLVWGLMGCAQAGLLPCATKAIGATFPKENQGFASGGLAACMALGSAISHWLSGQLLGPLNWQQILALYSLPGLCWAVMFAKFVPRWDDRATRPDPFAEEMGLPASEWSRLLLDRQMQLLCAQQFFRATAMALFYTWLPRYLREMHAVTEQRAGELAFWPPVAGMVGGFVGGLFSDWILRLTGSHRISRQGLGVISMTICALLGYSAFRVSDTGLVVVLLCVVSFWATACGVSGYALAINYGGNRVATVFATMNMIGNIGAGLFPFVVGWLVKETGNWNYAILVFAGSFAASAFCWLILNPKGTLFGNPATNNAVEEKQ